MQITAQSPKADEALSQNSLLDVEIVRMLHNLTRINLSSMLRGVSQAEFLALYLVHKYGEYTSESQQGINVSALADKLEVTSPAVSRVLKTLEQKGLVERVTDKANRRNTHILLTESGKAILKDDLQIVSDFSKRVFEKISKEEISQLLNISVKLNSIMQEELKQADI